MPHRLLLLTQVMCLAATIPGAAAETPPNVVIILGDDQAWTDFGFMGHPVIQTPHLDKLASESAAFVRGYVPSSLCRPSLATLMTGRYPHEHKICGNDPPKGTDRQDLLRHVRQLPMLPKWLGDKGYLSFQSGKWWEGNYKEGGFTHGMTHGDPAKGGRHGDLGLKIGREGNQPVADFLDQAKGKLFFVWYAPMLPHTPHNPPERLLKKYQTADRPLPIAKYFAMCELWDENVGEILAMLDNRKLRDNTLVVFVTDNGWIQRPDANAFAPKSKRSPYDGGLRAPLLVRWPGHVAPGRFETPVSSIDIAPTILKACGVTPSSPLPGRDLIAIAKQNGKSDRTALFGEIFAHDVADIDRPAKSLEYRWTLSEGRWKLIVPTDAAATPELYDVTVDPREETDLAARHPDVVRKLTQSLDAWWTPGR